jgi:hypothetical protein
LLRFEQCRRGRRRNAPIDDEPGTEEDDAAAAEGRAYLARRTKSESGDHWI